MASFEEFTMEELCNQLTEKINKRIEYERKLDGPGYTRDEARVITKHINALREAISALNWEIWARTRWLS